MTDFNELELNKPVDEMEEEEAKKTLSEFMESHKKNQTAYDELQTEFDDAVDELEEDIEKRNEKLAEFKERRAEEAAQYVKMPAPLLAERFDFSELDQIIEEAEEADTEFSEESTEEGEEEDDDGLTTFANREEKGRTDSGRTSSEYRERATSVLSNKGFPTGE